MPVTPSGVLFPLDLADPMQDARNMPPPYHYPGRRDPEQEAEDKRLTEKSKREALDAAAVETRAALLKHMGKIRPGRISPPSWDTYKNTPGVSGNSAMTDYILRYNAENPQHPFRPEVYTPQARPAAPQSRAMQNTPAVGVQADPAAAKKAITDGPFGNGAMDPWAAMANAGFAEASPQVRDEAVNKRIVTPGQALTASRADASRADASPPNAAPASAPDDTAARQRVLNRDFSGPKPDGRPDVVYGWAGYGGTGRQLVSVPRGEHNGQAYSDARREFYRKHEQDRADAYAGTMQRGQKPSAAGFRAWNKANPFNSDMHARAARAYADAATAPRPVAFYAPPTALNRAQATAAGAPSDAYNAMRMPDGSLGYARPGGSPTLTTGRSASATFPNGKVERTAFSATPTTDAVTNAGLGLDALMPGAGLAMTAGAMGVGATNTRGGSMIAQAVKPPGSDTADPNSVASQAKAATSSVANTPMPITSAVKQAATGAATLPMGYEAGRSAFGALKTGAGLIEGGIKNTSDAIGGTVKGVANFARGFVGASPLDSLSGPPIISTETRQPGPLWNPPPDTAPPAVSDDEMAKWRASVGAPDPKEGKGNPYDKRKRNGAYASLAP